MENAEDMESFLLFSVLKFHIFRIVFIIIPTCKEWGSRGRRFDSCHSDHKKHLDFCLSAFYYLEDKVHQADS